MNFLSNFARSITSTLLVALGSGIFTAVGMGIGWCTIHVAVQHGCGPCEVFLCSLWFELCAIR